MKEIMGRWKDEAWIARAGTSGLPDGCRNSAFPFFPLKSEEGTIMNQEKRLEKRIEKSLLANITINGFDGLGLVYNFSKGGLFISTTKTFPPHSKLMIVLASRDDLFELSGEVVWSAGTGNKFTEQSSIGMGVKFDNPRDDYVKFVQTQA